jgi:PAS domain S-box-containing protein
LNGAEGMGRLALAQGFGRLEEGIVADDRAASDQERRREIERTLRESERQFRLLVESVVDYAIFMLSVDGRVVSWNSGATRIKGYEASEIVGQDHSRFYTEEDRAKGMPGLVLQTARERGQYEAEGWRVRKDGSRFWASVVVDAIRDDDGALIGFSKVTRDITERKEAQARDARFRRVVETAPSAMVMINAAGTIEMVNAQAEHIFGHSRTDMLGQPVEMLVPERFRRHHPGLRGSFLADPQSRPMGAGRDLFGLKKDGSEFPIEIGLNPIETEEGTMVLSAIVDISARKRLEERFRRVVEAAPSAMVMINETGRIEMVNAQAEQVFGYARQEMLGQPVEMLVPERFRGHHPDPRGSLFADPKARPMGAGRDLFGLKKDGTEFPIEIGLNPIETDEGPMVLSAIVDISARKRLEERFRRVVEAAPNAMVMINASGRIEMVNAQAEQVFGHARQEMLGQPVEMLVPQRFRADHPGLRSFFFVDPRARPMGAGRDLFGLRKDGSEFPVEIGLNPIETDEGPMVLSAIVDISDRKQKEERVQLALKEKDVLLGEVHHRVKNNLQIIHSLLDLQSARISDAAALDLLLDSQNRIRSMALIHQTLYQSKDFAKVDFRHFLDSLVPTLVASYGINPDRITLSIEAAQLFLPINAAIPCGLVVNELISNALKHAFPGDRRGEIAVELIADPSGKAVLSVADNGIGIPDEIDMSKTSTLGLQLVTLLTDQLGGEITTRRSNPTEFVLTFAIES